MLPRKKEQHGGGDKKKERETNILLCFVLFSLAVEADLYIQGVTGGTDQTSGGCSLC